MNPTVGRPKQRPALTRDVRRVLAVVAHPDDESFGLGAVLDRFVSCGIDTSVLCFTHGEASTLRQRDGDLVTVRASELRAAAMTLGIGQVELLDYPDGRLDQTPVADLAVHVTERISRWQPSHLLVFDEGGVTGHPDHRQATRAALSAAVDAGLPVLAWTIPDRVAGVLNARHGTTFGGRPDSDIDARLSVSRTRQARAIAAHASQSTGNPVLAQRLRLLGDTEHLRLLYAPNTKGTAMTYGYTTRLPEPFSPALVDRVREALKAQGFGVLTEIDMRATLAAKLGADIEDYVILGACNPPLAQRALDVDRQIGLLLPCNIVIRADGDGATLVEALDPQLMVEVTGQAGLKPVADEAAARLHAALDSLGR